MISNMKLIMSFILLFISLSLLHCYSDDGNGVSKKKCRKYLLIGIEQAMVRCSIPGYQQFVHSIDYDSCMKIELLLLPYNCIPGI